MVLKSAGLFEVHKVAGARHDDTSAASGSVALRKRFGSRHGASSSPVTRSTGTESAQRVREVPERRPRRQHAPQRHRHAGHRMLAELFGEAMPASFVLGAQALRIAAAGKLPGKRRHADGFGMRGLRWLSCDIRPAAPAWRRIRHRQSSASGQVAGSEARNAVLQSRPSTIRRCGRTLATARTTSARSSAART